MIDKCHAVKMSNAASCDRLYVNVQCTYWQTSGGPKPIQFKKIVQLTITCMFRGELIGTLH